MLKKRIEYTDFNGEKQAEDFYFHLSKTDLFELKLDGDDGMVGRIETLMKEKDELRIFAVLKEIVMRAYGVRSADGKSFRKSPQLSEDFTYTAAYDQLMTEFFTNVEAAALFIKGAVPADLSEKLPDDLSPENVENFRKELEGGADTEKPQVSIPPTELTQKDLQSMSREELAAAFEAFRAQGSS